MFSVVIDVLHLVAEKPEHSLLPASGNIRRNRMSITASLVSWYSSMKMLRVAARHDARQLVVSGVGDARDRKQVVVIDPTLEELGAPIRVLHLKPGGDPLPVPL